MKDLYFNYNRGGLSNGGKLPQHSQTQGGKKKSAGQEGKSRGGENFEEEKDFNAISMGGINTTTCEKEKQVRAKDQRNGLTTLEELKTAATTGGGKKT